MRVLTAMMLLAALWLASVSQAFAFETEERAALRSWSQAFSGTSSPLPAEALYESAASSIDLLRARREDFLWQKFENRKRKLQGGQETAQWKKRKLHLLRARTTRRLNDMKSSWEEAHQEIQALADDVYRKAGQNPLGDQFFATMTLETLSPWEAEAAASIGIGAYRISWDWRWYEPYRGAPRSWDSFDHIVRIAAQAGLTILPAVHSTPPGWAGDWRRLPVLTDDQRNGWRRFLEESVRRYGPGGAFWKENSYLEPQPIRVWQIWNEPNDYWFTTPVSPVSYTELLQNSAVAIRSIDREAQIIAAGLFGPSRNDPPMSLSPEAFVRGMYQAGAEGYFDGLALHPYARGWRGMRRSIERFDFDVPLWITEIGWQSDRATVFGVGSEAAQAEQLRHAYDYLLRWRRRLDLQMVSWFALRDAPDYLETCQACYRSGLLHNNFSPKPAWYALGEVLAP